MKASKITRCGIFASVALIIYVVESLVPPLVPIPGFKIGLANTVTLAAVYILGYKEAFFILLVRILLGNMFTGQMMSLVYSLAGGLLCYGVTVLLKRFFPPDTMWALGIIGAICHNLGQVVCASILFDSMSFLYYGAALGLLSFVSGAFTGLCARFAVKYIKKY